ncbi:hypothetical protein [Shinella sp.]|uniref:hypothetical protein n=1 Tax=Shinella sp. TaxID=1870904 RepID=UPI0039E4B8CA
MIKIFSRLTGALLARIDATEAPVWVRDPLAHPEIEAMDSRRLGDLPFGLFRMPAEAGPCRRGRAA